MENRRAARALENDKKTFEIRYRMQKLCTFQWNQKIQEFFAKLKKQHKISPRPFHAYLSHAMAKIWYQYIKMISTPASPTCNDQISLYLSDCPLVSKSTPGNRHHKNGWNFYQSLSLTCTTTLPKQIFKINFQFFLGTPNRQCTVDFLNSAQCNLLLELSSTSKMVKIWEFWVYACNGGLIRPF